MKRAAHRCRVPDCGEVCPRRYPFCLYCWRRVEPELREAVRAELAKPAHRSDPAALREAIEKAADSIWRYAPMGRAASRWERLYRRAGFPPLG